MLMEVDPTAYFETDHYKGWAAVLLRLSKIGAPKLRHRLEQSWRLKALKTIGRAVRRQTLTAGQPHIGSAIHDRH